MANIDNTLGNINNSEAVWGSITGNILNQTDLINYLEDNTINTLTGTLVDNTDPNNPVVNIPDIDQVLGVGGVATDKILQLYDSASSKNSEVAPDAMLCNMVGGSAGFVGDEVFVGFSGSSSSNIPTVISLVRSGIRFKRDVFQTNLEFENPTGTTGKILFPDVANATKTIAMVEDIVIPTLQEVLDQNNTANQSIILDEGAGGWNIQINPGGYGISVTDTSTNLISYVSESAVGSSNVANTKFAFVDVNGSDGKVILRSITSTGNANIIAPNLTDNRIITIPDASGTIAYVNQIPDISGKLNINAGANFRLTASDGSGNRGNVNAITGGRALKSDANGIPTHFDTTTEPSLAELTHVKGVTSPIQIQLNSKENTITAGTISQYYRGDKTFQNLDKTAVGLSNVDNTSDINKPISTAQQIALNNRTSNAIKRAGATTPVTGTTLESLLSSDEIIGGFYNTNDIMQLVSARFIKTGSLGLCTYRIRINTTNTLVGAVEIARFINGNIYTKIGNRTYTITGGNLRGFSFTDNGITGGQDTGTTSLPEASTPYNPANSIFVFTTAQLANSGDSTILRELLITN